MTNHFGWSTLETLYHRQSQDILANLTDLFGWGYRYTVLLGIECGARFHIKPPGSDSEWQTFATADAALDYMSAYMCSEIIADVTFDENHRPSKYKRLWDDIQNHDGGDE